MIDFHTHILPGLDDGSQDVDESLKMIELTKNTGIDTIIATPHFDINLISIEDFITKRKESFEKVISNEYFSYVKILLGAEVSYYPGIDRLQDIKKLCIENTNILLLEMPMKRWSSSTIQSLTSLSLRGDIRLMIAHIERYFSFQDKEIWNLLSNNEVIMQSNASFFTDKKTKRQALKMLKNGQIDVLGSDCHNTNNRKPNLNEAIEIIRKKLGNEYIDHFENYSNIILNY